MAQFAYSQPLLEVFQLFGSMVFEILARVGQFDVGEPGESDDSRCPFSSPVLQIGRSVSVASIRTLYFGGCQMLTVFLLEDLTLQILKQSES